VPKRASSTALASATQRNRNPATSATPSEVSATVAAHARNGITAAGMNAFTSAVYCRKPGNRDSPGSPSQIPKRLATADRNAAPIAPRA